MAAKIPIRGLTASPGNSYCLEFPLNKRYLVASPCMGGPGTVIKYSMDMVCSEWGSRPHAFMLDGGQASHSNVVVVSAKRLDCCVCVC